MADRISMLPDEVLYHILSFLPTEKAVATSVLSKRWNPLWLLVPTFDFDEGRFLLPGGNRTRSSFIHFVYATILARGFHQPIKTLRFKSKSLIPDLKIWLNAAIQREVESIEIKFSFMSNVPFNNLSCRSLVVLKLDWLRFSPFSSVDLPSLKTLHLMGVKFSTFQHFRELIYGSPILENLQLKYITFDTSSVEGKFKTLPKLVWAHVSSFTYDDIPLEAICNVEFLRLDQYYDVNVNNPVFPNLMHMELILGRKFKWSSVLDLLSHCPQLQTFVLDNDNLHGRSKGWPDSLAVPECISSRLWKCVVKNFTGLKGEMRFAKYVMRNSTSLRTMKICSVPDLDDQKKLKMITKLASCPRSSVTCELLFK